METAATRLNCEDIQGWQGWLEGICFSSIMSVFPVESNDEVSHRLTICTSLNYKPNQSASSLLEAWKEKPRLDIAVETQLGVFGLISQYLLVERHVHCKSQGLLIIYCGFLLFCRAKICNYYLFLQIKYRISSHIHHQHCTNIQQDTESCLYFAILQNYWWHGEGEGEADPELFTKVQHQHLSSDAVDDEKMICFDQTYLTTKWGIINHHLAKTPS